MATDWPSATVAELQHQGVLLVEDGNHGEYRPRPDEFVQTGVAFIRAADMDDGRVLFEVADHINETARARITKGIGAPGDVLLSHKGTVGKVALVRDDAPAFVCSPQTTFWRTRNKDRLDPRYLYAFLRSPGFHLQLASRAGETDMAPYVSLTAQRALRVSLPPMDVQRSIGRILAALDDKIELDRQMNETLEAMARALFKSWFVDFDPVRVKAVGRDPALPQRIADLFPDRFDMSELGEIPAGWRVGRFGTVAETVREPVDPRLAPNSVFSHFSIPAFDDDQTAKAEPGEAIRSLKWGVPPGAVLLSKLNPEIERVWLTDVKDDHSVCSTEFVVLRPRQPFGRPYLYCLARSPSVRQRLESLVTGTSKSHQRAHVEDILMLPTILPPAHVNEAFDSAAAPLLERILVAKRQSLTLASLRDALLPKLISGELRVAELEHA